MTLLDMVVRLRSLGFGQREIARMDLLSFFSLHESTERLRAKDQLDALFAAQGQGSSGKKWIEERLKLLETEGQETQTDLAGLRAFGRGGK